MSYRSSRLLRRTLLAAPLVFIPLVLLATPAMAATGLDPLLPNAASANGQRLYQLYNLISIPALVVFVLVETLLVIIMVRDRRSRRGPGYRPPQWHGNTRLEVVWTVVPFLILLVIGTLSFNELRMDFVRPADADTNLDIRVEGHQFGYVYRYPQGFTVTSEAFAAADNPMVIPTGKLVRLQLDSRDVIHGWWVPDLTGKTDMVPGYSNYTWLKVDHPGDWRGECTELCGAGHYTMQIRVRAVSPDEFDRWAAEQQRAAQKARQSPSPAAGASPRPSAGVSPSPSPSGGAASPAPSPSGSAAPSPSPS